LNWLSENENICPPWNFRCIIKIIRSVHGRNFRFKYRYLIVMIHPALGQKFCEMVITRVLQDNLESRKSSFVPSRRTIGIVPKIVQDGTNGVVTIEKKKLMSRLFMTLIWKPVVYFNFALFLTNILIFKQIKEKKKRKRNIGSVEKVCCLLLQTGIFMFWGWGDKRDFTGQFEKFLDRTFAIGTKRKMVLQVCNS
jgi:hypothetical protein